jgi:hypothetical protein
MKYVASEGLAAAVRSAIQPFSAQDRHSAASADGQYVIHSLYLDTPRRDLYRVSREGRAERFKVRVRRYEGHDGTPSERVYLELKRKTNGFVRKSRTPVPAAGWVEHLAAPVPAGAGAAEQAFRHAVDAYALAPALLVRYEREAWFSVIDDYARVTFDRRILCQTSRGWSLDCDPSAWLPIDHAGSMRAVSGAVLVELKCTRDVPTWMAGVIERLDLSRTGYSKYCNGVERVRDDDALLSLLARSPSWS